MTDISYIKWATFSVGTDISLSGLQTIIDSDTSLNVHLKTTNTQNYNIQPTTTGANYMVYRLKKSWVNDYSYNDNSTHVLDNTDWEQITNDASMLVPHEAYWLKYKLCENTNSVGLYIENGTLKLIYNGGTPLSGFTTTNPSWQVGDPIYFSHMKLHLTGGGSSATLASNLNGNLLVIQQSDTYIHVINNNTRVELSSPSTIVELFTGLSQTTVIKTDTLVGIASTSAFGTGYAGELVGSDLGILGTGA